MKKIYALVPLTLVLASRSTTPATPDVPVVPTTSTAAVQTGSGYEDKEVQETMKEIDSILSTDSGSVVK